MMQDLYCYCNCNRISEGRSQSSFGVVYGKAGDKVYRVIDIEMVKEEKPEIEYVRIYGAT